MACINWRSCAISQSKWPIPEGNMVRIRNHGSAITDEIRDWLATDEASGYYMQYFWTTPGDRPDTSVVLGREWHFSDPDTAFEFKMRFG